MPARPGHTAIIPARGGSKRLPRKNLLPLKGKNLISYTIQAALDSGLFERVVVSTEDTEIAEVSLRSGAVVSPRPAELATDTATVTQTCLDFLRQEELAGRNVDVLCCLYPTAPLRGPQDIFGVADLIGQDGCAFAMAVTSYPYPPHQALRLGSNGTLEPMWPELVNKQSQQIGELWVDNGSTYAVKVPEFLEIRSFYGPGLKGYRMPRDRSADIDTVEDLPWLEYLCQRVNP